MFAVNGCFVLRGSYINVYHSNFSVSICKPHQSIAGQKFHTVRLGAVTEYVTLALPRLQLRAIALTSVNCAVESAMLLETLDCNTAQNSDVKDLST